MQTTNGSIHPPTPTMSPKSRLKPVFEPNAFNDPALIQQFADLEIASGPKSPLQCPVPHAQNQALPPGHPPTNSSNPQSTLHPPPDRRCVFFRTTLDDFATPTATPPLSRSPSIISNANINPLPAGEQVAQLDPASVIVLASRNSQLALVQSSHVSAMLRANYGKGSPSFPEAPGDDLNALNARIGTGDRPDTPDSTDLPVVPLEYYTAPELDHFQNRAIALGLTTTTSNEPGIGPISFPITSLSTAGDINSHSPLYVIGGEGRSIWTKELEVALAAGAVDAIVHCLKDVPTALPHGLELAAVLEREDPRDALVVKAGLPYKTLDELPAGSVIGTSSVRRVAQLRRRYPNLVFSDVRGNLITRLAKLDSPTGPYSALVLAAAGLTRLALGERITAFLSSPVLLHSVGQGSLTIEIRTPDRERAPEQFDRDTRIKSIIASIADWRAAFRAAAERGLLAELEGGCSIPVGVESWFEDHEVVEGRRNEGGKGQCPVMGFQDAPEAHKTEGHTIPRTAPLGYPETSKKATGKQPAAAPAIPVLPIGHPDIPHLPAPAEDFSSRTQVAEIRSLAPSEGRTLHLAALVVSLDGSRSVSYTHSQNCRTEADAAALGREVAHALLDGRGTFERRADPNNPHPHPDAKEALEGARAILAEVEAHRHHAELADARRREERAKRAAAAAVGRDVQNGQGAAQAHAALAGVSAQQLAAHDTDHDAGAAASVFALDPSGAPTSPEAKAMVEKERKAAIALQKEGMDTGEVDRRGVPRDDGIPKAWEV